MRLSLGYAVIWAVLAGIFCGLFFGPLCNVVKPIGDIYIRFLQMVALPYIFFSLIHGLGSISPEIGKKLFLKGWPFWVLLWAIIFAIIFLLSFLIPKAIPVFVGNVSIGRDSTLAKNFLNYLVPENPFYDLANNILPAIAIFGLIVGISLMHLEKKEPFLSFFERANQIIELILKWLAILSPIGIFAHIAVVMGTVRFEELFALEFYVLSFIFVTLFITLWILPVILSSFTPLSFKDVLKAFQFVCLLPFATGLPTIALPFITYYMRELSIKHKVEDPNFPSTSQTVMPLCYSFGQIGNCLILFFIFFISFYFRHPFVGSEKALLSILTIPLSIGSSATSVNAVSFLIHQLNFPDESIELFSETLAFTLNFQVLLSIASVLTFIILVLYAYYGMLQIKWKQLFSQLALAFAVLIALIWIGKATIHLQDNYQNRYMELSIHDVIKNPVATKFLAKNETGTPRTTPTDVLIDVLKTGVLKVGYDTEVIPYCYRNQKGELAGYDIAYAYELARDLDATLEFYPMHLNQISEELNERKYDIGMSAIIMTEKRIVEMDFSHPYSEQDNVLIVPLKKLSQYRNLEKVLQMPGLKIGAIGAYKSVVERHFPLAKLIEDETPEGQGADIAKLIEAGRADVWLWSHVSGFIWCLSNPHFAVADYGGLLGKRYFAYPFRSASPDWSSFLNNWIILKEQSQFREKMHRYWIEGENPKVRPPRWSIIRNVLHWTR